MKITATKITFILALMLISLASHGFAQQNSLRGIRWELVNAYGQEAQRSIAFIEIGATRFTGNTGCNSMFGNVAIRGTRIDLSGIGMTKRMCKMMAGSIPESTFIKGLNEASRYSRVGNRLSLLNARGRTILKFRVSKVAPEPGDAGMYIEDQKWMLESIAGRQTFAPITGVFVNFDKSRQSAGGNTGCNVFGGTYRATGSTISITEIISTMRACEEGGKMQLEREFLAGLRATDKFEIRDGRLFLYRGRGLLLTLRGETK